MGTEKLVIKFKKRYSKLGTSGSAFLARVDKVFLEFRTTDGGAYFHDLERFNPDKEYIDIDGWYLRLLFIGEFEPFITYRTYTWSNCAKYYPNVGELFNIEIGGEELCPEQRFDETVEEAVIEFKKRYHKLGECKSATLVRVDKIDVVWTNDIWYRDWEYWHKDEGFNDDDACFDVEGWYLRLLFNCGTKSFITYIECSDINCAKYYPMIGKLFKIKIEDEEPEIEL